MKITLYKGLGFAHDTIEVEEGKPLCQSLPDIDFSHAAVIVNAVKSDGFYEPKEGDGVMVRVLPKGATLAVMLGIVSITMAVAAGVAAGVIAYKQKKELEKQKRELEKLASQTNNDSAINLPFLKGATNSLATGKSQPYFMGRNFFTPYLLTDKWYSLEGVDGQKQFVTQVFECGFGKQVLEKVQADDILIKTYDLNQGPQEGCSDLIDDSGAGGFSAGGKVDIAQSGGLFAGLTEANVRVASDTPQAEIPRAADISAGKKDKLVYSLDPNAKNVRVAISFMGGLYRMNKNNGDKENLSVTITPSYSLDGGSTWIPFSFNQWTVAGHETDYYDTVRFYEEAYVANRMISQYQSMGYSVTSKDFDFLRGQAAYHVVMSKHIQEKPIYSSTANNEFTRNTIDEIRFEAAHNFTLSDYVTLHGNEQTQILIQVVNGNEADTQNRDTAHLLYYQSQCFDPDKSQTPAGTMSAEDYAAANPQGTGLEDCEVVSAKIRSLSTMMAVRLKASQANESKMGKINFVSNSLAKICEDGEWSELKAVTANPAALLLEVLQSHTHPLSAFSDDELDLDAFADLYDFCETEGIRFNAVATQKNTKQKLLEQICSVCRATLYWNAEGQLSVAWDCAQDTVVAALDADSIIDVENEKEFSRSVDAIRITWLDEGDWKQKAFTIFNVGVTELDEDSVIKDMTVTGLTNFGQVAKFARYIMACMNIRQKTVNVKVGNEGICFSPCTRITVKDDSLGDTPQNLLITSAASNGNGWTLKCVDYDARVYNSGDIPQYKSTIEQFGRGADIPSIYLTAGEFDEFKASLNRGSLEVGTPDTPAIIRCAAYKDGMSIECAPLVQRGLNNALGKVHWQVAKAQSVAPAEISSWEDLPDTPELTTVYLFTRTGQGSDGYPEAADLNSSGSKWYFRAKVTNAYNKDSQWSVPAVVDVSSYGTWIVSPPTEVTHRVSGRSATLAFDQPPTSSGNGVYGEVKYKIEIQRFDDEDKWYDPADDENPYDNEENYKNEGENAQPSSEDGDTPTPTYLKDGKSTSHSFTQTLPLEGQNDVLYQYQWNYKRIPEGANDPFARLDSYGNPCKEGAGTAFFKSLMDSSLTVLTEIYGDKPDEQTQLPPPAVFGDKDLPIDDDLDGTTDRTESSVFGMNANYGEEEKPVTCWRYDQGIYELVYEKNEQQQDVLKAVFHDGKYCTVNNGSVVIGSDVFDFHTDQQGDYVTANNGTEKYYTFGMTRYMRYDLVDGADVRDTMYRYKITAFNLDGSDVVSYAAAKYIVVTALATSAKDLVESAITHNKLAEGAVWGDNLAAGSVTADKIAVKDLFAITGVFGKIQNNQLKSSSYNYWNLENGEFHVGNAMSITDPDDDSAEYIHFNPTLGKLFIKIANFIVKAITSIIQGILVVRSTLDVNKRVMVVVNPESSSQTVDGSSYPARSVTVNGTLTCNGGGSFTSGTFSSNVTSSRYFQGTGLRLPKASNGSAASAKFEVKGLAYDSNTKTLYIESGSY